ncbi:carbohydrate-binding protein [Streptomyces sp. NPDC005773]|uniref:carbohydrate-binding protein n=1 Tax=Streptomyces sp. NPDC005773 TaxID=3364727 RepID=UPI00367FEC59
MGRRALWATAAPRSARAVAGTVGRLALDAGLDATGHPSGFTVSTCTDGRKWGEPVAEVSGRSFTQEAVFAPETVRCLRITLTAPGDTGWAVNEIRLYADGPDAATTLQAEQATDVKGVTRGNAATGLLGSGDRLGFRQVRFSAGADRITVRVAAPGRGATGVLQVRLDSPKGRVVGVLPVRATGGADTWQEQSATLPHTVTGAHDVYLVAAGGEETAAVDWLTFRK